MKATYIDYSETNSFSASLLSYLSHDSKLEPFISCWPVIENFSKVITEKNAGINRELLVSVLKNQYGDSVYSDADSSLVTDNIERLALQNTYTVTTGHQLNIFTGPLYFIYKIVTAINLANDLKAFYPDKNFVPVYWMATEDHDFEEINHAKLHGKKFTWNEDAKGATGRLDPVTIRDTLKAYENALGLSEGSKKLCALLDEAYLNHSSLADATRFLVHQLFKQHGLVILDADDVELKRSFSEIVKQDILQQKSFQAITETSRKLEELGFKTQVHAREINFFYLQDKLRERIVFENEKWKVLNTDISFNSEELIAEIDEYPDRFSPNVVMRPLYQEVILPNLAYIGGGAEIIYWLQLKENFDQYGINFPLLVLRNSALITDKAFTQKLDQLKIAVKDIFSPTEKLKKEWIITNSEHTLHLDEELKEFEKVFQKLASRASKIDPTLVSSTEAVKARLERALSNLQQKLVKAEKRNHDGALTQIEALRTKYFPGNSLQERTENFGLFYSQQGDKFIAGLVQHFRPLDFKFTILES